MERLRFDFESDGYATVENLNSILYSSGWKRLTFMDGHERLLSGLLAKEIIEVSEARYTPEQEHAQEVWRMAERLTHILHKRGLDASLLDMVELFGVDAGFRPARHNTLYYPAQKAFIRCGDVQPAWLLELLENEDCASVFLFPSTQMYKKDTAYYVFSLAIPKKQFIEIVEKYRVALFKKMSAAIQETGLDGEA